MGRKPSTREGPPALYFYIGKCIAKHRVAADISQEQLAVKIGIGRTSIVNIESGNQRIQIEDLYRIADALGLRVSDLLPDANPRLLMSTEEAFLEFLRVGGEAEALHD